MINAYTIHTPAKNSSLYIYFNESKELRVQQLKSLQTKHPEGIVHLHEALSLTRKIGPLTVKNKKCVLDILLSIDSIGRKGQPYIVEQLKLIEADSYMYRKLHTLSNKQIERISIFIDVFTGKNTFIFNDKDLVGEHNELISDYYFMMCSWMLQNEEFNQNKGHIYYVSEMPLQQILPNFFKYEQGITRQHSFYEISESDIIVKSRDNYMLFNQYMNLPLEYEYFYRQKTYYYGEKEEIERKNMGKAVLEIQEANGTFNTMASLKNGAFSVNDVFLNTRTFDLLQVYKINDLQRAYINEVTKRLDKFYITCIKKPMFQKKTESNFQKGDILLKITDSTIIEKYL